MIMIMIMRGSAPGGWVLDEAEEEVVVVVVVEGRATTRMSARRRRRHIGINAVLCRHV